MHGYNQEWNTAYARVALVPAPASGPLQPFVPGTAALELGVYAALAQGLSLTKDGLPGGEVNVPGQIAQAAASATYSDRITFADASLSLGAPIKV